MNVDLPLQRFEHVVVHVLNTRGGLGEWWSGGHPALVEMTSKIFSRFPADCHLQECKILELNPLCVCHRLSLVLFVLVTVSVSVAGVWTVMTEWVLTVGTVVVTVEATVVVAVSVVVTVVVCGDVMTVLHVIVNCSDSVVTVSRDIRGQSVRSGLTVSRGGNGSANGGDKMVRVLVTVVDDVRTTIYKY